MKTGSLSLQGSVCSWAEYGYKNCVELYTNLSYNCNFELCFEAKEQDMCHLKGDPSQTSKSEEAPMKK